MPAISYSRSQRITRQLVGFIAVPLIVIAGTRLLGIRYASPIDRGESLHALTSAEQLVLMLEDYQARYHELPPPNRGLSALVPEFIDSAPLDPWGRPFLYQPSVDMRWADVISHGADGQRGGFGPATDISGRFGSLNWEANGRVSAWITLFFLIFIAIAWRATPSRAYACGALTGAAVLFAALTFTLIAPVDRFSLTIVLAATNALCCLVGAVGLIRDVPGARSLSAISVVLAYAMLGLLIAS